MTRRSLRLPFGFGRVGLTLLLAALLSGCSADSTPQPLARIAFGSCAKETKPQPIWASVIATRPGVFIFTGDNVYADTEDMDEMRATYAKLGAQPGYQRLRQNTTVLATWDDHDYGKNDIGADYPMREQSQEVFLDFWQEPADSPRRQHPGVYDAKIFGPAGRRTQIILLDTRYFRSPLLPCSPGKNCGRTPPYPYQPDFDPDATILGEAQWAWLEEQLRVPAELRLIVSSIQVISEEHPYEKWANHPLERERLFNLLRDTEATGVLFLSGDRHLAELSMMDAGLGYPAYDITSSALTQSTHKWRPYEPNRHRVGTMNWGDNFGLLLVDWNADDPLIRLQIRDVEGEVTIQRKIFLSTLRPADPES